MSNNWLTSEWLINAICLAVILLGTSIWFSIKMYKGKKKDTEAIQ